MHPRITVWLLGDQLLSDHPALRHAETFTSREAIRVLMIESVQRLRQLPYQRKKLVLLLSAMRHYAARLHAQGYTVDYRQADDFPSALRQHTLEWQPERFITMAGAEYGMRQYQQNGLQADTGCAIDLLPNTQFLVEHFSPYPQPAPGKRYLMENFYREMRRQFHVLVDDGLEPLGGKWNFDHDNRKRLPKRWTPPPPLPEFVPDAITRAAVADVDRLEHGIGTTDGFALAVTHEEAEMVLDAFLRERLPHFGAYEDAMSADSAAVYHSMLSPYLNIGLLDPLAVMRRAEAAYFVEHAPINAVEGFIRQILGWREYVYWRYWVQMPELRLANGWRAERPMPQMFWDGQTDMRCIHLLVRRLLEQGYNHHIERLMVICNFCLLAGIRPDAVADWFLSFYIDAYDWVVLPNVIGMGLHADGGQTATKPYIASANYIHKMSDYCSGCAYDPRQRTGERACPFNFLYWNFLIEHETTLRANHRLGQNVLGLRHLDDAERGLVQAQAREFLARLEYYENGRG